MSKNKNESVRYIYVRNDDKSKPGYQRYSDAALVASGLGDGEKLERVRVCYRRRTNTWDVVVKTRREVKQSEKLTPVQVQADKDLAFIADHALTGR